MGLDKVELVYRITLASQKRKRKGVGPKGSRAYTLNVNRSCEISKSYSVYDMPESFLLTPGSYLAYKQLFRFFLLRNIMILKK